MNIMELLRQGYTKTAIAQELNVDWKTVDKYIKNKGQRIVKNRQKSSKLDPYKDYIRLRLEKLPKLTSKRLYKEIKQRGYPGQISILRDFVHQIKSERHRLAVIRFETVPGEQAQFDFKHAGKIFMGGILVPLYAFVAILGYSRVRFVEFVLSMKLPVLLRCLKHAFAYWKGVPKEGLFDRMKTVVIEGTWDDVRFHPRFLDFAMHYQFRPKACRPYRPQTKGKVERTIGYFAQDFLYGKEDLPLGLLNEQAILWYHDGNNQLHHETNEIPFERLKREKLTPLPDMDYDTSFIEHRRVNKESRISLWANRYSVHPDAVGKTVTVKIDEWNQVHIFDKDRCVGLHELCLDKHKWMIDPDHEKAIWKMLHLNQRENKKTSLILPPEVEIRPLSLYEEVVSL